MPCKQLATHESGAVIGAICEDADGAHHLFTATKGAVSRPAATTPPTRRCSTTTHRTPRFSLFTDFRDGSALLWPA